MKKMTLFSDGECYGAEFRDGDEITSWSSLTRQEQIDLLTAMASMHELFSRFVKVEKKGGKE